MSIKHTTETFIQRAIEVHGDKYDYSLVNYKNATAKVTIICKQHGSWEQTPNNHLSNHGCKVCGNEAKAATAKSEFATKASIVHDNKYDYSLVAYKNAATKVKIICPIHGSFEQQPNSHLNKSGCPICSLSESGFTRTSFANKCEKNNNSLGILYILGCFNDDKTEVFIKIGITSRSIKQRYPNKTHMPYNYKVLHEISGSPEFIYDLETLLHTKSKNYRYTPITSFGGSSTECFLADKDYLDKLNIHMFNLVPF